MQISYCYKENDRRSCHGIGCHPLHTDNIDHIDNHRWAAAAYPDRLYLVESPGLGHHRRSQCLDTAYPAIRAGALHAFNAKGYYLTIRDGHYTITLDSIYRDG